MAPMEGDGSEDAARRNSGRGRNVPFLVSSFLVAFVIWVLFNLSQDYSVFLDYGLRVRTDIRDREKTAVADDRLMVRVKAGGFYIVFHRMGLHDGEVELSVGGEHLTVTDSESDLFSINLQDVFSDVVSAFGPEVEVESVVSKTVNVTLPKVDVRKVPVALNFSLKCEPQYMLSGHPVLSPDSVVISGPSGEVSSVEMVRTESISLRGVKSDVHGMAGIHPIKGVTISEQGVMYSLKVGRYVDESLMIPVSVRNVPAGKKVMVLPNEVEVTCRRFFPLAEKLEPTEFGCYVDYDELVSSHSSDIIPELVPPGGRRIVSGSMNPSVVQCIILDI